ncbi:MAG: efflux RND transporter periplasmic adaptor subunit [Spirochaetes bacterium]|nr:efflux RND transporter periplasmic adaptor subunit [Spirochaetota bacterium]
MSANDDDVAARDAGNDARKAGAGAAAASGRTQGKPATADPAKPGPGSTGKARKGPRLVGGIVLVLLLLLGLGIGTLWVVDSIAWTSTDDASIDCNRVNVASKVLGRIRSIEVAEGDKVVAGQTVVILDDTDLMAQKISASAALATARENLALSRINLDKTQDDFNRTEILYGTQAATREAYDHAAKALETAHAQSAIARAQVVSADAQLGVIAASLLNTRIAVPLAGTVQKEVFMRGDVVQPGQTIISVNNLDGVWVNANFEETKIGRITVGAKVLVTVDALGGKSLEGVVAMIGAGIVAPAFSIGDFTKTTQRIPVKIRFVSPVGGFALLPGMSVEVKVRTQAKLPASLETLHF